jgi:hypothetical protein
LSGNGNKGSILTKLFAVHGASRTGRHMDVDVGSIKIFSFFMVGEIAKYWYADDNLQWRREK